jgi:hypothetical protein
MVFSIFLFSPLFCAIASGVPNHLASKILVSRRQGKENREF